MYKYETHCHTSIGSRCATITPYEVVDNYKSRGYAGVFITEHFLNGNTTIDRNQPWDKLINEYCRPYEIAKKYGDEVGLDVMFGWEYTYGYFGRGGKSCTGSDFLTYGLDKQWLLLHPEIMELELPEYCDLIHENGGFIVHAHPFREAGYIDMIRLVPRHVDGVEVINSSMKDDSVNAMANMYAKHYGLLKTSGSDNHTFDREKFSGIYTKNILDNPLDMFKELKDGTAEIFVEKADGTVL